MKYLYLVSLLFFSSACKEEVKDSSSSCSCLDLSYADQVRSISNLYGTLKLTPPPLDRIEGQVYVLIDEKHVFSDEWHRLLEQEININYEELSYGECGTYEPEPTPATAYIDNSNSGTYRQNQSCSCSYDLQSETIYHKPTVTAVARGNLESVDRISLQLDFEFPDYRSVYYIGIHIDRDGDGTISEGDYYTKEFVEINMTGGNEMRLVADRIQSEKIIATGIIDLNGLSVPQTGTKLTTTLYDISVPAGPRKISSATKPLDSDFSFSLLALPETQNATWQLTAWIDNNSDGVLDRCDYVEATRLIRYNLDDLQNISVPMARAGGHEAECMTDEEQEVPDVPEAP